MIDLNIEDKNLYKKIVELLSEYYPDEKFRYSKNRTENPYYAIKYSNLGNLFLEFYDKTLNLDKKIIYSKDNWKKEDIKQLFYKKLATYIYPLPWGSLVAVRPTSLFKKYSYTNKKERARYLEQYFNVSSFRASLASEIYEIEEDVLKQSKNKYGIYINIPFCPSKCTYCSFPSIVKRRSENLYHSYINTLIEEIKLNSMLYSEMSLGEVYIGGGTPAILNERDFERIFHTLDNYCRMDESTEITVELGRPELITVDQLDALTYFSVNQISINAQSLNNSVLSEINRGHSKNDFLNSYMMVKSNYNFMVNVDLILGLPNESVDSYKASLNEILDLSPDFLTFHTLCAKKGANLNLVSNDKIFKRVENMWMLTYKGLSLKQYKPYYLYRQKRMVAPFENLGFSKEGLINRYNLLMISGSYPILGIGMGATSKLVQNKKTKTIVNYRNMKSYLVDYKKTFEEKRKYLEEERDA